MSQITIVVAAARNGVIGRDGGMPWHLPTDLRHFKALTWGRPVVMGRKTWASIGRPLPGRPNIVISRLPGFQAEGADVASSLEAALALAADKAAALGVDDVCVIGGGDIYRQAMTFADTIHMTVVDAEIAGDTVFAPIDPALFEKVVETAAPRGEKDSHALIFTTWRRRAA